MPRSSAAVLPQGQPAVVEVTRLEATLLAVRKCRTVGEAAGELKTTPRGLQKFWERSRAKHPDIGMLRNLLGADLSWSPPAELLSRPAASQPSGGDAADLVDPSETEIVIPKEARPPSIPPDHSVADTGDVPRNILCVSDIHFPVEDKAVISAITAFARDVKPQAVVLNGDVFDCWLISMHPKEPERVFEPVALLQAEFDAARPFITEMCALAERVHFTPGNHENRFGKLVSANLGLFGLRALEWKSLAGLPDRVTVHRYGARLRIGAMTFIHGDRIGSRFGLPKHAAAWLLDNHGSMNTCFGHSHRLEVKYRTTWDEHGAPHQYVAINQGHCSDVTKQQYVTEPNWQTGFVYVENWTEAGRPRFTAHAIPVVGGRFSWGGREYGRRSQ